MHEYYHSEGYTDLTAIRNDANYRLRKGRPQEESLIHLHPKHYRSRTNLNLEGSSSTGIWLDKLVPCTANAFTRDEEDKQHEWFLFDDLEAHERPQFEVGITSNYEVVKAQIVELPIVELPEEPKPWREDGWREDG